VEEPGRHRVADQDHFGHAPLEPSEEPVDGARSIARTRRRPAPSASIPTSAVSTIIATSRW
jgi:hypothetical protein